jgi:hypothetical protein
MSVTPIPRRLIFLVFYTTWLGLNSLVSGQMIDPRGVFFHSYTGPASGLEWIDIRKIDGPDRYQFSDIRGIAPYRGEIVDGNIDWDNTGTSSGIGTFSTQDDATMTLMYFGGSYQSTLRRAPGTDADFTTQIDSPTMGSGIANGQWNLVVSDLDPSTGLVLNELHTTATTVVDDELLRLTLEDESYFQGVFEEPMRVGFRVVVPSGNLPAQFASFPGSETSLTRNLLGDLRFETNSFSATFLTQTRTAPGSQRQFVQVLTGTRVVPEPSLDWWLGIWVLIILKDRYRTSPRLRQSERDSARDERQTDEIQRVVTPIVCPRILCRR